MRVFRLARCVPSFWLSRVALQTSDHGEMGLEHRQNWKNSMYEPSVRVPLIITPYNVPGLAGGQVVTVPTSHLDILPTLVRMIAWLIEGWGGGG